MSAPPHPAPSGSRPAALLVLAWCLLVAWFPLCDLDWGWHLATFERWMAEGRLPWDDRFAWGSEGAYEPVHTLFQLCVGGLHRLCGLTGLVVYRAVLHAAIGLALWGGLRRRGPGPWAAAVLTLLVLAGSTGRLLERPHLFTTLGLVLLLDRLLRCRDEGAHPWPLVPLLGLWSCAHPGVVFGAMTLSGFVLAEVAWSLLARARGRPPRVPPERLARLAAWSVAALAATGLNPLSWDLFPYLLAHREMQGAIEVAELRGLFQHPERGIPVGHLLMSGLWLGGALVALRHPRRLDPTLGCAALAFAALGVVLAREGPLALIVLAFALAPALRGLAGAPRRARIALLALALLTPACSVGARLREGVRAGLEPGVYAVGPADWILAQRPQGRLWNTNWTGGYLVWRLARDPGGWLVHTDGRMPMFGRALREARDFPRFLDRRRPEILVLDWGPGPLSAQGFELDPSFARDFALVHVSSGGRVYLRREGRNPELVRRFAYEQLRYVGRFWPGRVGVDAQGRRFQAQPPADPAAFAREVERARAEDPANPHLPPPP